MVQATKSASVAQWQSNGFVSRSATGTLGTENRRRRQVFEAARAALALVQQLGTETSRLRQRHVVSAAAGRLDAQRGVA